MADRYFKSFGALWTVWKMKTVLKMKRIEVYDSRRKTNEMDWIIGGMSGVKSAQLFGRLDVLKRLPNKHLLEFHETSFQIPEIFDVVHEMRPINCAL